jgi:hypothetical protein
MECSGHFRRRGPLARERITTHPCFPAVGIGGRDCDPPLIQDSGELRLIGCATIEFTLRGLPEDPQDTTEQLRAQKPSPNDPIARFRLIGTDEERAHWALGWTVP